ncbi:hypothetical protein [Desulfovibrio hydrothermalis]|uniref:hypothetical protein n=1 Tax=Maridesulfovibrio hydrothermalis TaxID=191026 RepID=UPI00138AF943
MNLKRGIHIGMGFDTAASTTCLICLTSKEVSISVWVLTDQGYHHQAAIHLSKEVSISVWVLTQQSRNPLFGIAAL